MPYLFPGQIYEQVGLYVSVCVFKHDKALGCHQIKIADMGILGFCQREQIGKWVLVRPYSLIVWAKPARRRQAEQHTPQVVTPPGQPTRTQAADPIGYTLSPIIPKQPAQLLAVTIGQYALDDQVGMLSKVEPIQIIFLETWCQAAWDAR